MHPNLTPEIARYRREDLLREAERARVAHRATHDEDGPRRSFRFSLKIRRAPAAATLRRPALG